jgi:hypothetical protein
MRNNHFIMETIHAKRAVDTVFDSVLHGLLTEGVYHQRNTVVGVDYMLKIMESPPPNRMPIIQFKSSAMSAPWKLERYYTLSEGLMAAVFGIWSCCEYGISPPENIMIGDITKDVLDCIERLKSTEQSHRLRMFSDLPRFGYSGDAGGPLHQTAQETYGRGISPQFGRGNSNMGYHHTMLQPRITPVNFRSGIRLDVAAHLAHRWCPAAFHGLLDPTAGMVGFCNHWWPGPQYTNDFIMTESMLTTFVNELERVHHVRAGVSSNIAETDIVLKAGVEYTPLSFVEEILKQGNPGHTRDEYLTHLGCLGVDLTKPLTDTMMHLFAFDYYLSLKFISEQNVDKVKLKEELLAKIQPKSKSVTVRGGIWLRQFGRNAKIADIDSLITYYTVFYPGWISNGSKPGRSDDFWLEPSQVSIMAEDIGIPKVIVK